jgi:hypothetical protein
MSIAKWKHKKNRRMPSVSEKLTKQTAEEHPSAWEDKDGVLPFIESVVRDIPDFEWIEGVFVSNLLKNSPPFQNHAKHVIIRKMQIPSLSALILCVHELYDETIAVHITLYDCIISSHRLEGLEVRPGLTMYKCHFEDQTASFQGVRFRNNLLIGSSYIVNPFFIFCVFDKGFSFNHSFIYGGAKIIATNFLGEANFDGSIFYGPTEWRDICFHSPSSFEDAKAHMKFDFQSDGRLVDFRRFYPELYESESWCKEIENALKQAELNWEIGKRFIIIGITPSEFAAEVRKKWTWLFVKSVSENPLLAKISLASIAGIPVIAAIYNSFQQNLSLDIWLPVSLALAFFASLACFVGYSIFRASCPASIRDHSVSTYKAYRMSEYARRPDTHMDDVRWAVDAIGILKKDKSSNFVSHHNETVWVPSSNDLHLFTDLDEPDQPVSKYRIKHDAGKISQSQIPGYVPSTERKRVAIEEGASAEYESGLVSKKWLLKTAVVCYILALVLILIVAVLQAITVINATAIFQ